MLSSFKGILDRRPKPPKPVFTNTRSYTPTPPATFHPYDINVLNIADHRPPPPNPNSQKFVLEPPPRPSLSNLPAESPKIQLNFELNSEPLDWFDGNGTTQSRPPLETHSGPSSTGAHETNGHSAPNLSTEMLPRSGDNGRINGREGDGGVPPTSNGQKGKRKDGEDTFPRGATNGWEIVTPLESNMAALGKKSIPAPIKIPDSSSHKPKHQVERPVEPLPTPSELSDSAGACSALSGTTLARELLADPYFDPLTIDYRSKSQRGAELERSELKRMDSATLPISPYASLRSPGREVSLTPSPGGPSISPVPPVPLDANQVYVPPRTPRRSDLRPPDSKRRVSKHFRGNSDSALLSPGGVRPNIISNARRISIIEEVPSVPSTPNLPQHRRSLDERPVSGVAEAVIASGSTLLEPPKPLQPEESSQPSPSRQLPRPPDTATAIQAEPQRDQEDGTPTSATTNIASANRSSTSPGSAKDLEYVLDYYIPPTPQEKQYWFRPGVSPISEESLSQLSPQSLRKIRESQRTGSTSSHKVSPGRSPESSVRRKNTDPRTPESSSSKGTLLPIGERPQTSPGDSPATSRSNYSQNSPSPTHRKAASVSDSPLKNRSRKRRRSATVPTPITISFDVKDRYNKIPQDVTETQDDEVKDMEQTFPETPSATIWSPGFLSPSVPQPSQNSAEFFSFEPSSPGEGDAARRESLLSQKALLVKAATVVRTRSQRKAVLEGRKFAWHPYFTSPTDSKNFGLDSKPAAKMTGGDGDIMSKSALMVDLDFGPSSTSVSGEGYLESAESDGFPRDAVRDSMMSSELTSHYHSIFPPIPPGPRNTPQSRPVSLQPSTDPPQHDGVDSHTSPVRETTTSSTTPAPAPTQHHGTPNPPKFLKNIASHNRNASTSSLPNPTDRQQQPPPPPPSSAPVTNATATQSQAQNSRSTPPRPIPLASQTSLHSEPNRAPASFPTNEFSEYYGSTPNANPNPNHGSGPSPSASSYASTTPFSQLSRFPSPPSYEIAVSDHGHGSTSPSTSVSTPAQSPPRTGRGVVPQQQFSPQNPRQASSDGNLKRTLMRPQVPFGPRRPSQPTTAGGNVIPLATCQQQRSRSDSATCLPGGRRLRSASTTQLPKFQNPPVKWRGYTMDAAKWTFTSAQLQGIVSRAVKQSAEASSIRLLKLEAVDNDIPEEMDRLEMQRTDVKTRYKMMSRRRACVIETLMGLLDGSEPEDSALSLKLVEELKELSISLDKAAEELHSLDEQLAQLRSLCDVHTGSALSVALRKLNSSFLKQVAETKALSERVALLEDDRDLAWKQAHDVANDYDNLNEKFVSEPEPSVNPVNPLNKRSSKILAVRKCSTRATNAGLRSAGRPGSSLSIGSSRMSAYSAMEEIPPVPPIPTRRQRQPPDAIHTNISQRMSRVSQRLSTEATPSSGARALAKAQEELYEMLGISTPAKSIKRSKSYTGRKGDDEVSTQPPTAISPNFRLRRRSSALGLVRPASLPGQEGLAEAYKAMTADQLAMLTTLNMLSDPSLTT